MTNASRDALRETIPPVLRRLRREKRYTKEVMAAKLNISARSYYDLEKGRSQCSAPVLVRTLNLIDDPGEQLRLLWALQRWMDLYESTAL